MPRPEDDPLVRLGNEIDAKWLSPIVQIDETAPGSVSAALERYDEYPDPEDNVRLTQVRPKQYIGYSRHPKAEWLTGGLALAGTSVLLVKTIRSAIKRVK